MYNLEKWDSAAHQGSLLHTQCLWLEHCFVFYLNTDVPQVLPDCVILLRHWYQVIICV